MSDLVVLVAVCVGGIVVGVARPEVRIVRTIATAIPIALVSLMTAPLLAYVTVVFVGPLIADRLDQCWTLLIAFGLAEAPSLVHLRLTCASSAARRASQRHGCTRQRPDTRCQGAVRRYRAAASSGPGGAHTAGRDWVACIGSPRDAADPW